ncbi:MAG: prepilin-type N-terminal cleavage/methylation domain-containing protein [Trueperaceae bacterium]
MDSDFAYHKLSTGSSRTLNGFTLLELLVVLAVVTILLGIAVVNYSRYRAKLELQGAQQVFVQELNRARSDSRRLSQHQRITWTDKKLAVGDREINLSDSNTVTLVKVKGSNTLSYFAPYGTIGATDYKFELRGRNNLVSSVYVYGVTGKVKADD